MMTYTNRRYRTSAPPERGFTLIELVIAVAIAAILLVVGVPSLSELMASQRVRSAANDLFMDLSYARSEAIKRNATVDVVRVLPDTNYPDPWTKGWTVQVGTTVLRSQPGMSRVSAKNLDDSDITVEKIVFLPDGRTDVAATFRGFKFSSPGSDPTKKSARCVSINPSGRPNVRADRGPNGIPDGDCTNG